VATTGQLGQGVTGWLGWRKGIETQGANQAGKRVNGETTGLWRPAGIAVTSPVTGARKVLRSGTRLPEIERSRESEGECG
jgi:hypothetical protein